MSRMVEQKVARRVRGFEGRAKAAEENAAKLRERLQEVEAVAQSQGKSLASLEKIVAQQAEQIAFLRVAIAQVDEKAQARIVGLMASVVASGAPMVQMHAEASEPAAS